MKFECGVLLDDKNFPADKLMWGKLHYSNDKCFYHECKCANSDVMEKATKQAYNDLLNTCQELYIEFNPQDWSDEMIKDRIKKQAEINFLNINEIVTDIEIGFVQNNSNLKYAKCKCTIKST